MLTEVRSKRFANGVVYALQTDDGYPIEVTDTFLPYYTKNATGRRRNDLVNGDLGSRRQRWMIGVSVMSGCPVGCKFCATGALPRWRRLWFDEIFDQVAFVLEKNRNVRPDEAMEFKINYTRMGEPFLNQQEVRSAIEELDSHIPNVHHYLSTIGIRGSDFSWVRDNITLQLSVHSLDPERRRELIPFPTMSLEEMAAIRVTTRNKITVNLTLVDEADFDISRMKALFDPKYFFVKLSPINTNAISDANGLGIGVIQASNLV